MKIWLGLLLVILLAVMPFISACDLLGIGGVSSYERQQQEHYQRQIEAYQKQREYYQEQQEAYNKQTQQALQEWTKAYSEWQQQQQLQQLQQLPGMPTANQSGGTPTDNQS